MRRAVFANANAVVRHDVDHRQVHQRGEAQRGLEVVRKDEERGAERMEPTVKLDAIADCRHGELANAKVDVRARAIFHAEESLALELGFVARREIRAAAEEVRQVLRKDV